MARFKGKTPIEKVCELLNKTTLSEEVWANFDLSQERIQESNYQTDLALREVTKGK